MLGPGFGPFVFVIIITILWLIMSLFDQHMEYLGFLIQALWSVTFLLIIYVLCAYDYTPIAWVLIFFMIVLNLSVVMIACIRLHA